MTPKEKAISLYNRFRDIAPPLEANVRSKNHALILAEAMVYELSDLPRIPYNERRTEYWRSVKSEVEKLK